MSPRGPGRCAAAPAAFDVLVGDMNSGRTFLFDRNKPFTDAHIRWQLNPVGPGHPMEHRFQDTSGDGQILLAATGTPDSGRASVYRRRERSCCAGGMRRQGHPGPAGRGPARRRFLLAVPRPGHRTIEADHLNGEIVLLGRLHGVPTPLNALLQRLASRFARERRPAGSLPVTGLVRLADEAARQGGRPPRRPAVCRDARGGDAPRAAIGPGKGGPIGPGDRSTGPLASAV